LRQSIRTSGTSPKLQLNGAFFTRSGPKLCGDAAGGLYDAGGMDEKAVRRAALITLRRAIWERFPPGRERDAWLTWAATARARAASASQ